MVDELVVQVVRRYLQALVEQGIPAPKAVVFGSQATGHTHAWSDIDLLVISSKFDAPRTRENVNLLWRIAARTDSRIEPIPVGEQQYETDDSSAIIEIARREGQRIPLTE